MIEYRKCYFEQKEFGMVTCCTIFTTSLCTERMLIFVKQHPLNLAMYYDDLEVCNLLSSEAGKHKVNMFYY